MLALYKRDVLGLALPVSGGRKGYFMCYGLPVMPLYHVYGGTGFESGSAQGNLGLDRIDIDWKAGLQVMTQSPAFVSNNHSSWTGGLALHLQKIPDFNFDHFSYGFKIQALTDFKTTRAEAYALAEYTFVKGFTERTGALSLYAGVGAAFAPAQSQPLDFAFTAGLKFGFLTQFK